GVTAGAREQLAHRARVGQWLEGRRCLRERIDLLDVARQLARGAPAGERLYGGLVLLCLLAHPRSPEHAEDGAALQQYEIERQFWNLSGGKSDDQVAALPGERTQRRLAVAAAP